ncbi:MAG TPA: GNAT family N-acetyltransferase [Solirubrobacteraceae bacterium]|nr:GNAT family N-acetyltransferase [Solirubrobacteraceae bacterium]
MRYKARKLLGVYRERGPEAAAREVAGVLGARLYRDEEHAVLRKALDAGASPVEAHQGLEVRDATEGDHEAIVAFCAAHFPPRVVRYVRNYLANGYRAFLAFRGGRLIGLFWWVDGEVDAQHPDLVLHGIRLAPREAYGFAYFVAPEQRGGGTATEFLARISRALAGAGYTALWGWVLVGNRPARWLFRIAGFQEVGRVRVRMLAWGVALARRRVLVRNLGLRSPHAFGYRVLLA